MSVLANPGGVFVLASGDDTGWFDIRALLSAEFNIVVGAGATVILEVSNDLSAAKIDTNTVESYSSSTARTIFSPMPHFLRMRQTIGAVVSYFSWGGCVAIGGGVAPTPSVQSNTNAPLGTFA